MVKVEPFQVEIWMDEYETKVDYNIAETCSDSISVSDLQALSSDPSSKSPFDSKARLDYGAIFGSDVLRQNLADIYNAETPGNILPKENILITPGAILANYLFLYSFVGADDHVICHFPTYQQLYSVPRSFGAEVTLWRTEMADSWRLNLEELKRSIKPNTKLIIINNPQNPTGAVTPVETLKQIIEIAQSHNPPITILSDEVYRPLFPNSTSSSTPPSILGLGYEHTVATGSLSKAYSLAGTRVGWIASRDKAIVDLCAKARDYTTISVSKICDSIAAFALSAEVRPNLLKRNTDLAEGNMQLLEEFIGGHQDTCRWVKPRGGTTTFVQFLTSPRHASPGQPVDDVVLCKRLIEEAGVMFVPGSLCFGDEVSTFAGFVRIGYVPSRKVLEEGLVKLREWIDEHYDELPLWSAEH